MRHLAFSSGVAEDRILLTCDVVSLGKWFVTFPTSVAEYVWNVMAHAQKPDLVFQRNGRVHLNWRRGGGGAVQSTTGSRGVRISSSNGSNAGYTMFWGRVQDYWLPTPLACSPFSSPTVRHRVPSGFNWTLHPSSVSGCPRLLTLWLWSWKFTVYHLIYVKFEYFVNQEG
jgi:hypothetical protein